MTNGEKMQAVFPDIEMWGESKDTLDYSLGGMIHRVTKSWWNAEYKEPKIGHWIDDKCSICGKGIEDLIDSREWYRNEEPNFCPFCGLKLVDPQESEE